jgi:hypothetical protein
LEEERKAGLQCKSLACFIFYFWSADLRGVGLGMAMVDLIPWTYVSSLLSFDSRMGVASLR